MGMPEGSWRNEEAFKPSPNCAPGWLLPIVKSDKEGTLELHTCKWGLVPSFTKPGDKLDFFRMVGHLDFKFNARSETVGEKSIFSRLLARHRCVVLLNGFYEWHKEGPGSNKQPYHISLGEGRLTPMAGLWDMWSGAEDGPLFTFTILTTDASKRFSWLHDRMPVMLPTVELQQAWLSGSEGISPKQIVEPYNEPDLVWHPVTKAMSSMRYQADDAYRELKRHDIASFFGKKPTKAAAKPALHPESAIAAEQPKAVKHEPAAAGQQPKLEQAAAEQSQVAVGAERLWESAAAEQPEQEDCQNAAEAQQPLNTDQAGGVVKAEGLAQPEADGTQGARLQSASRAKQTGGLDSSGEQGSTSRPRPALSSRKRTASTPASTTAAKRKAAGAQPGKAAKTLNSFFSPKKQT